MWSEGHPLSVTANQLVADMVRKLGGFSFQELALPLDDLNRMTSGGPDLSYDFFTRPAYDHALLTGDAEFLRLTMRVMHEYKVDTGTLIHALQNHDELTMGIGLANAPLRRPPCRRESGRRHSSHVRGTIFQISPSSVATYNAPSGPCTSERTRAVGSPDTVVALVAIPPLSSCKMSRR